MSARKKTHLIILGHRIALVYIDMGTDDYAEYDSHKRCINLNINPSTRWDEHPVGSLFHESMHCVFDLTGWSTALKKLGCDWLEESLIEVLEIALAPLIRFK